MPGPSVVYTQIQGSRAVLRFNQTNTVVVAANSSVNSDLSDSAHGNDAITGATITQIHWTLPASANVTLLRGSNTKVILNGTGSWNFRQGGISPFIDDPAATIVLTFSTAANTAGTVVLEVSKQYATTNPPHTGGT